MTRGLFGVFSVVGGVAALLLSCESRPSASNETPSADGGSDGGHGTLDPIGPEIPGWEETKIDGVTCRHPSVVEACKDAWCKIPAGCFIMGSPDTEPGHAVFKEILTAVTLTRSYEIGQFEVTRQQWLVLVPRVPIKPPPTKDSTKPCYEGDCPVPYVSWFDALHFSNLLSAAHSPPFEPCYVLEGCQGEAGQGFSCATVTLNAASTPYDCEGYRLPTEAEWEYAARAGTRSAFYSGEMSATKFDLVDPMLDPIAWYYATSNDALHPTGRKHPNRWGLFDVLGNVAEWTSDFDLGRDPPGPLMDPSSPVELRTDVTDYRRRKGAGAFGSPWQVRAGGLLGDSPASRISISPRPHAEMIREGTDVFGSAPVPL